MNGILRLAYKLLVNDKAKFTALLVGITFAVFLMIQMIQMTSMFAGILSRASATVFNLGAPMWVMDPSVQTVASAIGMPDYVLDAVRSMPGVSYAVPVYTGGALVKLSDGNVRYKSGLDPYLNVITAETALLANQQAGVQLIKALGGGWDASRLETGTNGVDR